ncbi:hypothetical protein D9619_011104 [Psilocybe cf. subviscida]|uniref:Uncharacterized protein n=1 Tax=Psilocybe cf. subviscida TaxID=2480587 RepID=A0A8H5BJF1_9AGAR|nr:hypothetical protein D9619_011104 [Psilocybe cf. subviscida]
MKLPITLFSLCLAVIAAAQADSGLKGSVKGEGAPAPAPPKAKVPIPPKVDNPPKPPIKPAAKPPSSLFPCKYSCPLRDTVGTPLAKKLSAFGWDFDGYFVKAAQGRAGKGKGETKGKGWYDIFECVHWNIYTVAKQLSIAGLLLIFTLSTVVQAAPLLPHSTASTLGLSDKSDATASAHVGHGVVDFNPSGDVYNEAQLHVINHHTAHTGSLGPHDKAHAPLIHPPQLKKDGKAQEVVLAKRFSFKGAIHHIGHAIHKVAHDVKHAAHFIAHNGPKIAKIGLKIAATASQVAGKAARFMPGMGPLAGKAMTEASKRLNKASDAIHAHIGGKFGAVMNGMNKAQHIVDRIP